MVIGRSTKRKVLLVALSALLAACGLAAAVAVATGSEAGSPAILAESLTTPGTGPRGGRTPEQVLEAAANRIGRNVLVSKRIGGPPPGFQPTEDPAAPVPEEYRTGRWAFFAIDYTPDTPVLLERIWRTQLIAGVVRDELYSDRVPTLVNGWTSYTLPSGEEGRVDLVGGTAKGQVFEQRAATEIVAQLREGAAEEGVTVMSAEIVAGLQPAPLVRVTTADPKATARGLDELVDALFGGSFTYEGFFLDVRDRNGKPVAVKAMAARVGIGSGWVRPDLDPGSLPPAPHGVTPTN